MKNDETFTAFQFDIYLPEGMELDEVGPIVFSDRFPSTPGRPNQIPIYTHVYDCRRHDKDGVFWRVIVYSTKNDPISGNSGDLLYMYYVTDESLKPGIHPVQIKNVVMAISGTQDVKPDDSSSFFYTEGYDASSVVKLDFSGLTGYVASDVVAKTNEIIADNKSLTEMDLSGIDKAGGNFASANPNCLMYVRQGAPIAESMKGENNVVEMSDNGNVCSRYVLTDGYDANVSVPFTASTASYSRTVPSAGWYSLCLPYSVPANDDVEVECFESLDVQKSIREYIPKTMDRNLFLLERYPDYIFNFEGGIKYSWMKEYFPEKYDLVKKYIRQGRWHVTGSTWDATDTNIPSPESFTRNILYGQHFYREEFGVEGTDIFLPDCFGFGWTLPTIAAHSGLIGFSTQKLQWRNNPFYGDSKIPFEIGLWQGVDGSRIMLVADAHNYTTRWRYEDLSHSRNLVRYAEKSPIKSVYHYYGTGDTGGSPTIESVRALERGLAGDGPVEIISAESDRLYKDYLPYEDHPELPVWNGELLMDVHGTGCYTSQAAMKLYNRRNEQLADAAERSAVAADWLGTAAYPQDFLSEAWKRFIWHQFHDDLTGTSLPRAYEFSWNDELVSLKQFAGVLTSSVGAVSTELDTYVKGTPVVIYNSIAAPVTDMVEVSVPYCGKKVSVYGPDGKQVPCQVLSSEPDGMTVLLFQASAPAAGYAVYDVRKGGRSSWDSSVEVTANTIENSVYKVTLDGNGDICSIVDKRCGRELVEKGKAVRLALFTGNPSYNWPAWEIMKSTVDSAPVSVTDGVGISVAESGPVRGSLRVERTYGDSRFVQYVTLSEGGESDRIDIRSEIDWQTTDALLKAEFPLSVSNPEAVYDLGVGSMARGNNTDIAYEVYAQQWADLTEEDGAYGVSVLNDSKYGWDKPSDNTLRLTLLHTPSTQGRYTYQSRQDFGHHIFTYSIVGHAGDFRTAGTVRKAEVLNQPLKAFSVGKHRGALGRTEPLRT